MQTGTTPAPRRAARAALAALLAVALAAMPLLAGGKPAWAETGTASIAITNATSGTYYVYELIYGTFENDDEEDTVMGGDAYVTENVEDVLLEALAYFGHEVTTSGKSDRAIAIAAMDAIAAIEDEGATQEFANYLAGKLSESAGVEATATATATADSDDGTVTFTGLDTGYYLVVQAATADSAMTSALLMPVTSAGRTIDAKVSTPVPTKQVKGASGEWDGDFSDAADVGVYTDADGNYTASSLTYLITGTVASNIEDYTSGYYYQFVDVLPTALQFSSMTDRVEWSITAAIGSQTADITSAFTGAATISEGETTLTWTTDDLIAALTDAGFSAGTLADAVISVEYTVAFTSSELEDYFKECTMLSDPLTNTVYIKYSNNPYYNNEGSTSTTVEVPVPVYSFNLQILKVDEDGEMLTGATFELTREDEEAGIQIVADDDGLFTITGLEAGVEYTLTEVGVPAGHKSIDPITFTIDAETSSVDGSVTGISVTEGSDPSEAATWTTSDATATVTVVNVEGDDMPLTGMAGIAFGCLAGAALIAAGLVLAATRKGDRAA